MKRIKTKYQNIKKKKKINRLMTEGAIPQNEKGKSCVDDLIITRKPNRPELIFN